MENVDSNCAWRQLYLPMYINAHNTWPLACCHSNFQQ